MGSVTGMFHGGVTVLDMDRSLEFYRDGLGLEVEFDKILDGPYLRVVLDSSHESIRAVYLRVPDGPFIELLEYRGVDRRSAASEPFHHGSGHICLYVEGIDDLVDRLHEAGFRARSDGAQDITSGPNQGARSIYMLDPDGYPVELFQRPSA